MKTLFLFLIFSVTAAFSQNYNPIESGRDFGKGVTAKDTVSVSALLENPEKYVGKEVAVMGNITGVCEKKEVAGLNFPETSPIRQSQLKLKTEKLYSPWKRKAKKPLPKEYLRL